jgi:cyclopropane-fatty-acyl-phospholipid synthase
MARAVVKQGTLTLIGPDHTDTFGEGAPEITVRLHDRRAIWELALHPDLKLGELYMDGRLTIEKGDIAGLLDLIMLNIAHNRTTRLMRFGRAVRHVLRRFEQFNPVSRAKAHVAHHYDLSGRLYDLFLDKDRQYSCAYFSEPGESLDEAQIAKKRHIAAKLCLDKPGLKVLDIGCGWGGLALDLARDCGARTLGVTLSEEQIAVAKERSARARLEDRCKFELVDYRKLGGTFDRIVSVGMFEHVGVPYYQAYFDKVRDLLADDGVALIHTIGRSDGPGVTNAWIAKYIFPGGYTPALSEMLPAIERAGLIVSDVEVLRLHYAETLKQWRHRIRTHWSELAELYDERFCRMWEFYLAGSEMSFRRDGLVVYQVQLVKDIATLPITRDYMIEAERTMKFAGTEHMPRPKRVA